MPIPKHSNLPFTDAQWQWVAARYLEGYTEKALGDFLGIHRNTVRFHLRKMGVIPWAKEELCPLEDMKKEFMELAKS